MKQKHETAARPVAAVALAAVVALGGCAAPRQQVKVETPTTMRPKPVAAELVPTGGIYASAMYVPLFEDRKPRHPGDILTIQLNEKLNATQSANVDTERKNTANATIPKISGILGGGLAAFTAAANTDNKFDGTGQAASSNAFTGTITVTVIEVLANGNLVVAGEKQMGIRQNSEVLRFAGVVDPSQVQPGNTISSTQVADVRLDLKGGGSLEEAQMQGWLSRFFNSWSPF